MQKIYTIGETVLDIIFKNFIPVTAKAGGSMLNTAVSLGRMGLPVHFISEYGTDTVGEMIGLFLIENNIDTEFVYKYTNGKSALALAFLNEKNNASYSFYKDYSPERFNVKWPEIKKNDIIIFGSYYGITYEIRDKLRQFLLYAKKMEALIIYDPNYRKSHLFELDRLKPAIIENMSIANIVRCSDEDIKMIFNLNSPKEAYQTVKTLCPIMIYSKSTEGVYLFTPEISEKFPVRKIEPLSTIGAGDSFNAGLTYGIFQNKIVKDSLYSINIEKWKELIEYGIEFATDVCLSFDNYISKEFADKKSMLKNGDKT